jgi:hypothetical protein
MRYRTNKWIFSTVLSIVLTIPFLLPGCTDQTGTDALLGGTGGMLSSAKFRSVLDSVVELANIQAQAAGREVTVDDITSIGSAVSELGATLKLNGPGEVDVIDASGAVTCRISVDGALGATYTCP